MRSGVLVPEVLVLVLVGVWVWDRGGCGGSGARWVGILVLSLKSMRLLVAVDEEVACEDECECFEIGRAHV